MSAGEYIWASIHTEHMPGYVWPTSRHLCLSRALLLGWLPWRHPVKTNCPARLSGVGTEEWTTTRSTRGEEGGLELRV